MPQRSITAVRLFTGLTSSICAFAKAAASWAIESLQERMTALLTMGAVRVTGAIPHDLKTDRSPLRAFGPDAMPKGFLGVLRDQRLELDLRHLMLDMGGAGPSKGGGILGPGIRGTHVHDADHRKLRLRRLGPKHAG